MRFTTSEEQIGKSVQIFELTMDSIDEFFNHAQQPELVTRRTD